LDQAVAAYDNMRARIGAQQHEANKDRSIGAPSREVPGAVGRAIEAAFREVPHPENVPKPGRPVNEVQLPVWEDYREIRKYLAEHPGATVSTAGSGWGWQPEVLDPNGKAIAVLKIGASADYGESKGIDLMPHLTGEGSWLQQGATSLARAIGPDPSKGSELGEAPLGLETGYGYREYMGDAGEHVGKAAPTFTTMMAKGAPAAATWAGARGLQGLDEAEAWLYGLGERVAGSGGFFTRGRLQNEADAKPYENIAKDVESFWRDVPATEEVGKFAGQGWGRTLGEIASTVTPTEGTTVGGRALRFLRNAPQTTREAGKRLAQSPTAKQLFSSSPRAKRAALRAWTLPGKAARASKTVTEPLRENWEILKTEVPWVAGEGQGPLGRFISDQPAAAATRSIIKAGEEVAPQTVLRGTKAVADTSLRHAVDTAAERGFAATDATLKEMGLARGTPEGDRIVAEATNAMPSAEARQAASLEAQRLIEAWQMEQPRVFKTAVRKGLFQSPETEVYRAKKWLGSQETRAFDNAARPLPWNEEWKVQHLAQRAENARRALLDAEKRAFKDGALASVPAAQRAGVSAEARAFAANQEVVTSLWGKMLFRATREEHKVLQKAARALDDIYVTRAALAAVPDAERATIAEAARRHLAPLPLELQGLMAATSRDAGIFRRAHQTLRKAEQAAFDALKHPSTKALTPAQARARGAVASMSQDQQAELAGKVRAHYESGKRTGVSPEMQALIGELKPQLREFARASRKLAASEERAFSRVAGRVEGPGPKGLRAKRQALANVPEQERKGLSAALRKHLTSDIQPPSDAVRGLIRATLEPRAALAAAEKRIAEGGSFAPDPLHRYTGQNPTPPATQIASGEARLAGEAGATPWEGTRIPYDDWDTVPGLAKMKQTMTADELLQYRAVSQHEVDTFVDQVYRRELALGKTEEEATEAVRRARSMPFPQAMAESLGHVFAESRLPAKKAVGYFKNAFDNVYRRTDPENFMRVEDITYNPQFLSTPEREFLNAGKLQRIRTGAGTDAQKQRWLARAEAASQRVLSGTSAPTELRREIDAARAATNTMVRNVTGTVKKGNRWVLTSEQEGFLRERDMVALQSVSREEADRLAASVATRGDVRVHLGPEAASLDGMCVPREVAQALREAIRGQNLANSARMRQTAKWIDSWIGTQQRKQVVTRGNMGFTPRNDLDDLSKHLFSEGDGTVTAFFSKTPSGADLDLRRMVAVVSEAPLEGSASKIVWGGRRWSARQLLEYAKTEGKIGHGFARQMAREAEELPSAGKMFGPLRKPLDKGVAQVMRPGLWSERQADSVFRGLFDVDGHSLNPNMTANEGIRLMNLLARLKRGVHPAKAAQDMNRLFIDYGSKSALDEAMGVPIPFWKYYSHALPGVIQIALRNPRNYSRIADMAKAVERMDQAIEGGAVDPRLKPIEDQIMMAPMYRSSGKLTTMRPEVPSSTVVSIGGTFLGDTAQKPSKFLLPSAGGLWGLGTAQDIATNRNLLGLPEGMGEAHPGGLVPQVLGALADNPNMLAPGEVTPYLQALYFLSKYTPGVGRLYTPQLDMLVRALTGAGGSTASRTEQGTAQMLDRGTLSAFTGLRTQLVDPAWTTKSKAQRASKTIPPLVQQMVGQMKEKGKMQP